MMTITLDSSESTRVFRGVGSAPQTVFSGSRTDTGDWGSRTSSGQGSGSVLGFLARGLGEELLVHRISHNYSYEEAFGVRTGYDDWQREVVTLARTPRLTLTATDIGVAGMAPLTPNSVLMQGNGKFYLLASGQPPVPLESDSPPQIGLAVDRYGLFYSATTTRVLRWRQKNSVVRPFRGRTEKVVASADRRSYQGAMFSHGDEPRRMPFAHTLAALLALP